MVDILIAFIAGVVVGGLSISTVIYLYAHNDSTNIN